jgi:hypothetical protein
MAWPLWLGARFRRQPPRAKGARPLRASGGASVLHRADRDSAATTIERMAVHLLTAVSHPKAVACVKGRFFDRLDVKLNQLARFDGNELVSIDLRAMAAALFQGQKETV